MSICREKECWNEIYTFVLEVCYLIHNSLVMLRQVILNPKLEKKSNRTALFFEGCLRCGNDQLFVFVFFLCYHIGFTWLSLVCAHTSYCAYPNLNIYCPQPQWLLVLSWALKFCMWPRSYVNFFSQLLEQWRRSTRTSLKLSNDFLLFCSIKCMHD